MRRLSATGAAALGAAAAALGASAWHIARNAAPPTYDDAWYLEVSFRLWSALREGPLAFARAYVEAFRIKAPLLSLVPLPLYAAFGPGERVAAWANLPLAALSAWAWSRAAAAWWRGHPRGRDAAALAGALAALLPFSYGLSRVFFAETLVGALLGLWAWRCAEARPGDRREGLRLGAILGLGLLAKSTFPLLAAGLAWGARERLRPHAARALAVGALIASTWYAANLPYVAGFAWSAGFGSVARDYSGGGVFLVRLDWLGSVLRNGVSWPLAAVMAAVLAAAARRERLDAGSRAALLGLLPFAVYALGVNREPRFVAPLLPLLAALAARAAVSFPRPAARAAAAAALLGTGLAVCARQTFVVGGVRALAYNGVPSSDAGWDRGAVVDAAAAALGPAAVVAVALEHERLNANSLSSKAAERGLPLRFVNLGYAQSSVEAALIRLKDKNASGVLLVEGPAVSGSDAPAFLNRANAGVSAALRSGRLPARSAGRFAAAPGASAELWALDRR